MVVQAMRHCWSDAVQTWPLTEQVDVVALQVASIVNLHTCVVPASAPLDTHRSPAAQSSALVHCSWHRAKTHTYGELQSLFSEQVAASPTPDELLLQLAAATATDRGKPRPRSVRATLRCRKRMEIASLQD
jgi:hypothetical protein